MLKQPDDNQSSNSRSGRSRGTQTVPYVKVENLTSDPVRVKILGAIANVGFNDLIVKIAMGGRSYFYGLKANNPNYAKLLKAFGSDENKWVGEEFMFGLEWSDFHEKNFMSVLEAPALTSTKTKAR
jgi:hypothetical protein